MAWFLKPIIYIERILETFELTKGIRGNKMTVYYKDFYGNFWYERRFENKKDAMYFGNNLPRWFIWYIG